LKNPISPINSSFSSIMSSSISMNYFMDSWASTWCHLANSYKCLWAFQKNYCLFESIEGGSCNIKNPFDFNLRAHNPQNLLSYKPNIRKLLFMQFLLCQQIFEFFCHLYFIILKWFNYSFTANSNNFLLNFQEMI
jgi:hypothetical protein